MLMDDVSSFPRKENYTYITLKNSLNYENEKEPIGFSMKRKTIL